MSEEKTIAYAEWAIEEARKDSETAKRFVRWALISSGIALVGFLVALAVWFNQMMERGQ